jgi:epoxyqueuosine reductase QueG
MHRPHAQRIFEGEIGLYLLKRYGLGAMGIRFGSKDIEKILPKEMREVCRVGVCNPRYVQKKRRVMCYVPNEYGGPRWSAKPSEVWPGVKSVIVLIHFTPIGLDYSVRNMVLRLGEVLWNRLKIETHVLNEGGRARKENLVGEEDSFLKKSSYDARHRMILLKELAYYAGLGQYGKNSLLIHGQFGSDFKIQALFTGQELDYSRPMVPKAYPGCQKCNICVQGCPGGVLHRYKIFSLSDICRSIVRGGGRHGQRLSPKAIQWSKLAVRKKFICKACQSSCPVNRAHYKISC